MHNRQGTIAPSAGPAVIAAMRREGVRYARTANNPDTTKAPGGNSGDSILPTFAAFVEGLGCPLQIVALHPDSGKVSVAHVARPAELQHILESMLRLNADGWNVYYEVNPGAVGSRSNASEISRLRAVVGDADAKAGRSVNDCFATAAALPLPPTFTLATGGGVQVVYLLEEAELVTPENALIYEAVGRGIRASIDGDAVFDLPRIMRMPGFINWPNAKKRAAGRKPTKAKLWAASGRRYTLAELARAFVAPIMSGPVATPANLNADLSGGLAVDRWFDRLSPEEKNACLADMLQVPGVVALADTADGDPSPNWRTVLAACARSGAPDAYALCRTWAETSPRFDAHDFDARYRSYCLD